ncbi:hypothetical protein AMECASPLE_038727 [Ameca splendens]|uniref:Uncharacterized protein n=1 Tax=Ameca splendens TaxID=208324 RepID=A0ABV0ZHW3_9TELE
MLILIIYFKNETKKRNGDYGGKGTAGRERKKKTKMRDGNLHKLCISSQSGSQITAFKSSQPQTHDHKHLRPLMLKQRNTYGYNIKGGRVSVLTCPQVMLGSRSTFRAT